ncbi:hypothetical protein EYF80_050595 [Liparis tanakae]|uniref:Uncharacterized protein n=1 Tax=Liparis tanakae TaxID=230148 RepID=A0A4Z2FDG4_9TELE|nr:hypothetical protein EYF80_050595 [Liparis tanakae]
MAAAVPETTPPWQAELHKLTLYWVQDSSHMLGAAATDSDEVTAQRRCNASGNFPHPAASSR